MEDSSTTNIYIDMVVVWEVVLDVEGSSLGRWWGVFCFWKVWLGLALLLFGLWTLVLFWGGLYHVLFWDWFLILFRRVWILRSKSLIYLQKGFCILFPWCSYRKLCWKFFEEGVVNFSWIELLDLHIEFWSSVRVEGWL